MLSIGLFNLKKSKQILPCICGFLQSESKRLCSVNPHPPNQNYDSEFSGRKVDNIKTASTKKPLRPPFVKNLFLGNFDREVLSYPHTVDQDRYEMLREMLNPIQSFFQEVDSKKIDSEAKIPPETLQELKELGLYGLQIPEEYGGLGLSNMEYARIAEVFALDGSIAVTLSAHQSLGVTGLLMAGTDEQKRKYLPKLASGEWTAALCVTETNMAFDIAAIETIAVPTDDGKGYYLSGTKSFVFNGETADILTVVARIKSPNKLPDNPPMTVFLVERNFGGIASGKREEKWGVRGSDTVEIHFNNTFVPNENVLGQVGDGFKLTLNILNSGRFSMGSSCAGVLKNFLESTIKHAGTREHLGSTLFEFSVIKDKLARLVIDVYAMESMAYLTAGLMDNYEGQDCTFESAIVKVFSSEKIWEHVSNCLQVLGGISFIKGHRYERILRDSRVAQAYDGTNDMMRLFIGLSGLEHAGKQIYSLVKKLRNPLLHPYFTLKTLYERSRYSRYNPKLDMKLYRCVHPILSKSADKLEYCAKRFRCSTEDFLGREGKNVVLPSNQLHVKRMADAAINLYAMTAVIGRASRSHYMGLDNSNQEIDMANYFVLSATERIKDSLGEVSQFTDDSGLIFKKVADSIFDKKGYPVEHPLTRTFW